MDSKYLLIVLLAVICLSCEALTAVRLLRRLDPSEINISSTRENINTTTEVSIIQARVEDRTEELPNMSYLTSSTQRSPTECYYQPCAWTFYSRLPNNNRQVIMSFNNKNCYCKEGSTCEYSEDLQIASAFIHRCSTPEANEELI